MLGWAEDVLDAADRLAAGVRSIRSGISHRLAIAASQTTAEHLVPHWLIELRTAEEEAGMQPTAVELTVANSTGVIEMVRGDRVNIGIIETPHLPPDLVRAYLREDELLVVAAPSHPWARLRRPVALAEVACLAARHARGRERNARHADGLPGCAGTPAVARATRG